MPEHNTNKIKKISSNFDINGTFIRALTYGSGHINDTFFVEFSGAKIGKYIFQRINHKIFKEPEKLMDNISRVLQHIAIIEQETSPTRQLKLIKTKEGKSFYKAEDGNYWRVDVFIQIHRRKRR